MTEQPQNADDVRRIVKDNGIEFLFAQFVDMHGKPSAKLVPAHHLDDLLTEGAGFAGFAAGDIGQGPDDPDMIAIPDPSTLTILPWRPTVARFACVVNDGLAHCHAYSTPPASVDPPAGATVP